MYAFEFKSPTAAKPASRVHTVTINRLLLLAPWNEAIIFYFYSIDKAVGVRRYDIKRRYFNILLHFAFFK